MSRDHRLKRLESFFFIVRECSSCSLSTTSALQYLQVVSIAGQLCSCSASEWARTHNWIDVLFNIVPQCLQSIGDSGHSSVMTSHRSCAMLFLYTSNGGLVVSHTLSCNWFWGRVQVWVSDVPFRAIIFSAILQVLFLYVLHLTLITTHCLKSAINMVIRVSGWVIGGVCEGEDEDSHQGPSVITPTALDCVLCHMAKTQTPSAYSLKLQPTGWC